MNKEDLILEAGRVLEKFNALNCTSCVLSIENGEVHAVTKLKQPLNYPPCLLINTWMMDNGLTAKQWSRIGSALFEQLSMETTK